MKSLVLVESPTKARTLSKFLGRDYRIEATMGHIRDLPRKKLGIAIKAQNGKEQGKKEYDFIPQYQTIPERRKRVAEIKKLAASMNQIILATDPDREGEAIAYHISCALEKLKSINFQRIVFHEITESAIRNALSHPKKIDTQLVDAQQGRRILDRLVGYKLSPLLWNKLGKNWLSAGRVQSVAVRLIVEREREILDFKPKEYWLVEVELEKNQNGDTGDVNSFIAKLVEIGGEKIEIRNIKEAGKIVDDLKKSIYKVIDIEEKKVKRYPSSPFTTSTMQQVASNRFGWSAKRIMRAAQNLYEQGLITYHRTDSTNLSKEAITMARKFIENVYGKNYLPSSARIYKTKSKVAQEAHEAIRPTSAKVLAQVDLDRISQEANQKYSFQKFDKTLGRDLELLYSLIWKRFVACQMNEAVFDHTIVSILARNEQDSQRITSPEKPDYLLKAVGERMRLDGWMKIYKKTQSSRQKDNSEKKKDLPLLEKEEALNLLQVLPQQKFTEPPPRFTEASLIKALEEKGIGRPSTYAPIISTIQDRKYVEKLERKFKPTDLGFAVNDFLIRHFPDIFNVSFTAQMEDRLDEIANGSLRWQKIISDFYAPFVAKLDKVFEAAEKVKIDYGETDEKCPKCGKKLTIRLSKYGKFLACTGFPDCNYTKNIVEKINIPCPRCGSDMLIKKTRKGKQFYGCSSYPKCKFAAWKKEDIK